MEAGKLLDALERVLGVACSAVLSTVDADGAPQSRWMVAGVLRGAPGYLYAVTAPRFSKVEQIQHNSRVLWLVQSPEFEEVLQVAGDAVIVDNPALKSSVLEALGHGLSTFWSINAGAGDLVVIETAITSIDYTRQSTGEHAHDSLHV